jgi:hypothetical protein
LELNVKSCRGKSRLVKMEQISGTSCEDRNAFFIAFGDSKSSIRVKWYQAVRIAEEEGR